MDLLLLATVILWSLDIFCYRYSYNVLLFLFISENGTGQFAGACTLLILLFVGESGTSRGRSWSPSVAQLFPSVGNTAGK